MKRVTRLSGLAGVLALAGCVVLPPAGPSLQALPGSRLSFEQFQIDDAACRQYAAVQIGGGSATEAAQQSQAAAPPSAPPPAPPSAAVPKRRPSVPASAC